MFKVTICDLKNKDRNMADITEKTGNGELVTNRDQLVVVDNIEPLIKVIRGQQVMLDRDLATLYGVEAYPLAFTPRAFSSSSVFLPFSSIARSVNATLAPSFAN